MSCAREEVGVHKHSSTPDVRHLRSCGTRGRNKLPARHLKFPGIWLFAAARGGEENLGRQSPSRRLSRAHVVSLLALILRGRGETQEGQKGQVGGVGLPWRWTRDKCHGLLDRVKDSAVAGPTASASHDSGLVEGQQPREPLLLTGLKLPFSSPDVDGLVLSNSKFDTTLQSVGGSLPLIGACLGWLWANRNRRFPWQFLGRHLWITKSNRSQCTTYCLKLIDLGFQTVGLKLWGYAGRSDSKGGL
jgi:hypothetical protein